MEWIALVNPSTSPAAQDAFGGLLRISGGFGVVVGAFFARKSYKEKGEKRWTSLPTILFTKGRRASVREKRDMDIYDNGNSIPMHLRPWGIKIQRYQDLSPHSTRINQNQAHPNSIRKVLLSHNLASTLAIKSSVGHFNTSNAVKCGAGQFSIPFLLCKNQRK